MWTIEKAAGRRAGSGRERGGDALSFSLPDPARSWSRLSLLVRSLFRSSSLTESLEQAIITTIDYWHDLLRAEQHFTPLRSHGHDYVACIRRLDRCQSKRISLFPIVVSRWAVARNGELILPRIGTKQNFQIRWNLQSVKIKVRESSFNMTRRGGGRGGEDIETRSLKF